jgi:hypothetical protein
VFVTQPAERAVYVLGAGTGLAAGAAAFTANGVPYASATNTLTTGSALTFDGTALAPDGTTRTLGTTSLRWGTVFATSLADGADQLLGSSGAQVRIGYGSAWTSQSFAIGGSEQMRLTSTGLGIGTSSPASKLHVNVTSGPVFAQISSGVNDMYLGYDSVSGMQTMQSDTGIYFATGASFTERMRLDSSGNMGIGTTNPQQKLVVSNAGAQGLEISPDAVSSAPALIAYNRSGSAYVQLSSLALQHVWQSGSSPSEKMRIDSSGNLGVGCVPDSIWPSATSASGDNGSTYRKTYLSISSNASILEYLNRNDGDGTITQYYRTGTAVGSVSVTSSATAYNTSSDYRLKDNPKPLTGSGAFIDALKPKTWEWKVDGSKGVGFIAHEAQEVSPSSVVGEKDGEQMQAMEYGSAEFIANIIAELQSLRQRVAQLEGK